VKKVPNLKVKLSVLHFTAVIRSNALPVRKKNVTLPAITSMTKVKVGTVRITDVVTFGNVM
jgi:hypothetical protein